MLPPGTRIDQTALDFRLPLIGGGTLSLAEQLSAGPLIVALFKVSCPTCQLAMPFLQRIADGARADAPRVVAISQDDAPATSAFLKHFDMTMPVLIDPASRRYPLSNAFGIEYVPTFFMLRIDGTVEHAFAGFVKSELAALGRRLGVETFRPGEHVPALKPG